MLPEKFDGRPEDPDLPVPNVTTRHIHLILTGTDDEMKAQVNRVASILGAHPHWEGGRYIARRELGGKVAYEVECLPHAYPATPAAVPAVAA